MSTERVEEAIFCCYVIKWYKAQGPIALGTTKRLCFVGGFEMHEKDLAATGWQQVQNPRPRTHNLLIPRSTFCCCATTTSQTQLS